MPKAADFGSLLRRFRRDAGLTQQQLADNAGISPRTVSDLERGLKQTPQPATLSLLLDALDLVPENRDILLASIRVRRHGVPRATPGFAIVPVPAASTPLVGREVDEAAAISLLRLRGVRLLTLLGPGGVGKSRLSVRISETVRGDYSDGVAFVPLAALNSLDQVIGAISRALGFHGSQSVSTVYGLGERIRDADLLVVLDNLEHLSDIGPLVSQILSACPRLAILATSRSPVQILGEQLFEVPPLRSPPADADIGIDVATSFSAIALFTQRVRAVRPDFELTISQLPVVREICRRLDGLPLALELAAAQCRYQSVTSLVAGLNFDDRSERGAPLDVPSRQQTMWNTIGWSYQLLTASEQRAFRALSVFAGGFTLDAAKYILDVPDRDVSTVMAKLADSSLLTVRNQETDNRRFVMLETVRTHGRQRAAAAGELEKQLDIHAKYFIELGREAESMVWEQGVAPMSAQMAVEHENFQAVLARLRGVGDIKRALLLAGSLVEYWIPSGFVSEGRVLIDELLEQAERHDIDPPASAVRGSGRLAWIQTDYDRAQVMYERAVSLFHASGDASREAATLNNLGANAHMRGDYSRASEYYDRAITVGRGAGSRRGLGMAISNLGLLALHQGDYNRAEELLGEGVTVWRQVGDNHFLAVCLGNLGSLSFRAGDYDEAVSIQEEALHMKQIVGDSLAVAKSRGDIALAEIYRGNLERATELLRLALVVFVDTGQRDAVAEAFETFAEIARRRNDFQRATKLYSGAHSIRESIGAEHRPVDIAHYENSLSTIRSEMPPDEYESAWTIGEDLTVDELIDLTDVSRL